MTEDQARIAFAAAALGGLIANPDTANIHESYAEVAAEAWRYADAMLEQTP